MEAIIAPALGHSASRVAVAYQDVGTRAGAHLVVSAADRVSAGRVAVADHQVASGGRLEVVVCAALRRALAGHRAVSDQRVVPVLGADEVPRPAGRVEGRVVVADDRVAAEFAVDHVFADPSVETAVEVGAVADDQVVCVAAVEVIVARAADQGRRGVVLEVARVVAGEYVVVSRAAVDDVAPAVADDPFLGLRPHDHVPVPGPEDHPAVTRGDEAGVGADDRRAVAEHGRPRVAGRRRGENGHRGTGHDRRQRGHRVEPSRSAANRSRGGP